jgi:hypothetical protein
MKAIRRLRSFVSSESGDDSLPSHAFRTVSEHVTIGTESWPALNHSHCPCGDRHSTFHSRPATVNGELSLLSLRCDESLCESLLSKPPGS